MSRLKEEWRPITGYEGLYEISNLGRVKSLERDETYMQNGKFCTRHRKEKIKKLVLGKGYYQVTLSKNGKDKKYLVNRLVYETFIGEIPEGLEVNHMDENPKNNAVWNLNLLTHKENGDWGTRNERIKKALSKSVIARDPITLKVVYEFSSTRDAESAGFDHTNIGRCCNKKQKTHKGLIWEWV